MQVRFVLRTHDHRCRKLACAVFAGALTAVLIPATANASPDGPGIAPPGETIGQYSRDAAPPVTGQDLAREQAKQKRVATQYRAYLDQLSQARAAGRTAEVAAATTGSIPEPLYGQINEDFCGAATTVMILTYLADRFNKPNMAWGGGGTFAQDHAAYWLGTDGATGSATNPVFHNHDGTAWYGSDNVPSFSGSSAYPVADVLRYRLHSNGGQQWYVVTGLPGSPTKAQQDTFVADLVTDVNTYWPQADNQYSINGYQFWYQPAGSWQHWWSARGYKSSGQSTGINDPARWQNESFTEHFVTTEGGAGTVVVALGGRGYIW